MKVRYWLPDEGQSCEDAVVLDVPEAAHPLDVLFSTVAPDFYHEQEGWDKDWPVKFRIAYDGFDFSAEVDCVAVPEFSVLGFEAHP